MLKRYKNSYVLSLAAYNAGESRVDSWIKIHGDPRNPSVDAIDWIELVPYAETRNYIHRGIEAFHIYHHNFSAKVTTFNPELALK